MAALRSSKPSTRQGPSNFGPPLQVAGNSLEFFVHDGRTQFSFAQGKRPRECHRGDVSLKSDFENKKV